jgi:integrase
MLRHFDARAAKSLLPGQHIIISDYPGLRLTATATTRTWVYRYKSPIDNRMRQTAIGHWPVVSFPAAIVEWEKLKADREKGIDHALKIKTNRQEKKKSEETQCHVDSENAYTVSVLCDEYLQGHVNQHRAKKGRTEIARMFNTMLGEVGSLPASSITRSIAFNLIQSYAALSPVQAGKLRCELGAAWDYAIDAGRLPETVANWWRLILRGKIRSKGKTIEGVKIGTAKRVLTEMEVAELIEWLPNFTKPLEDVLTLYLWTACRGAEIVSMVGSEIYEKNGQVWWSIPKHKTKNSRHENATDQRVPLYGRALAIVKRRKLLYGDSYLFPMRDKSSHIQQKYITEQVFYRQPYSQIRPEQVRPRLTVTHWAPHDLRRTARTILAELGCPDSVGESILGHMLPGVVGTYNRHKYDAEKQDWLKRLSDHLEGLVA